MYIYVFSTHCNTLQHNIHTCFCFICVCFDIHIYVYLLCMCMFYMYIYVFLYVYVFTYTPVKGSLAFSAIEYVFSQMSALCYFCYIKYLWSWLLRNSLENLKKWQEGSLALSTMGNSQSQIFLCVYVCIDQFKWLLRNSKKTRDLISLALSAIGNSQKFSKSALSMCVCMNTYQFTWLLRNSKVLRAAPCLICWRERTSPPHHPQSCKRSLSLARSRSRSFCLGERERQTERETERDQASFSHPVLVSVSLSLVLALSLSLSPSLSHPVSVSVSDSLYGVATISMLLKMIGLFCKRAL